MYRYINIFIHGYVVDGYIHIYIDVVLSNPHLGDSRICLINLSLSLSLPIACNILTDKFNSYHAKLIYYTCCTIIICCVWYHMALSYLKRKIGVHGNVYRHTGIEAPAPYTMPHPRPTSRNLTLCPASPGRKMPYIV